MEQKRTEELLRRKLREKGLKVTHQRLLILSVLEQNSGSYRMSVSTMTPKSATNTSRFLAVLPRRGFSAVPCNRLSD